MPPRLPRLSDQKEQSAMNTTAVHNASPGLMTGGDNRYLGYGPKSAPKKSTFDVTKPYNKKSATFGNGTMISLAADGRSVPRGRTRERRHG